LKQTNVRRGGLLWPSSPYIRKKGKLMKKITLATIAVGTMVLMSSLPAMAQWPKVTFTTTSSFYAGNAKMPAGTYTLRQEQDDPNAYTLQNSSGSHTVIIEGRPSSKASTGKTEVLFNRYGTTDYLETVETSTGNSVDLMSPVSEKLASKKGAPTPHTVPAK